jgi:hypothetical protein
MRWRARVKFMITSDSVQGREIVNVVERIHDLHATPQLAFQRREKEIASMQNSHVPALTLQITDHRYDSAKTTLVAVFYRTDTIGIIQVNKRKP